MNTVLATEGPLDVDATLSRYRLWGEDPTNCVAAGVFRRRPVSVREECGGRQAPGW